MSTSPPGLLGSRSMDKKKTLFETLLENVYTSYIFNANKNILWVFSKIALAIAEINCQIHILLLKLPQYFLSECF